MRSLFPKEIIEIIKEEMGNIGRDRVYWTIRGNYKSSHFNVDYPLVCIAIHNVGLPITPNLVASSLGKDTQIVYQALHRLGDLNILTLVRNGRRNLKYLVNPSFLKHLGLLEEEPMEVKE